MNDYPHKISCRQVTAASVSAVIAERIARGPFAPSTAEAADRTIQLVRNGDRLDAWENHGGLTPTPSVLALMLETTLTTGRFTDENQSLSGKPPKGDTLEIHHLVLDDAKQAIAFDDFVATIGDRVSKAFPIASHDSRYHLEWAGSSIDSVDQRMILYVSASLFDSQRGSILRDGRFAIGNFPILSPHGTFLIHGSERRFAVDDLSRAFGNMMRFVLATEVTPALDALTAESARRFSFDSLLSR